MKDWRRKSQQCCPLYYYKSSGIQGDSWLSLNLNQILLQGGGGIVDGEEEEKQEDGWSISSHEYFVVSFVFAVFKGILNLSVSVRFQADWRSNSPPTVSIVAVRVLVALNRHAAAAPMKCIIAHCAEFLMHCLPSV